MKNKKHHTTEISLSDLESITNFNQSFNENTRYQEFLPEGKERKSLSSSVVIIYLIIISFLFIFIGIIYKNSCIIKPNIPLFLIIFGILILINLLIYTIVGRTFLVLIRNVRSFSLQKEIIVFIAILFGIIFGIIIFIWWIIGTIWWIKLTLNIIPQLKHPTSLTLCHPVIYWTALVANILGLIGFIIQICIAIDGDMTASKQSLNNRV